MPRPRRKVGRPPKWTPELQAAICKYLELGVHEKHAARAAGISESTFHDWMKKGAAGIEPLATFRDAVEQATSQSAINLIARALGGGPGSAQALSLLPRRFPKEYGLQVQVGGIADGDPIWIDSERQAADATRGDPEATAKLHALIDEVTRALPNPDNDIDEEIPS